MENGVRKLLDRTAIAKELGVTTRTFDRLSEGLPYVTVGQRKRYILSEVIDALREREEGPAVGSVVVNRVRLFCPKVDVTDPNQFFFMFSSSKTVFIPHLSYFVIHIDYVDNESSEWRNVSLYTDTSIVRANGLEVFIT